MPLLKVITNVTHYRILHAFYFLPFQVIGFSKNIINPESSNDNSADNACYSAYYCKYILISLRKHNNVPILSKIKNVTFYSLTNQTLNYYLYYDKAPHTFALPLNLKHKLKKSVFLKT